MSPGGLSKARLGRMYDIMAGHVGRGDVPGIVLLPELAGRNVVKTLGGLLDAAVPANRPITVRDLLTFRMGFGMVMGPPDDDCGSETNSCDVSISRPLVRHVSRARVQPVEAVLEAPDPKPEGDITMRFMVLLKADKNTEAGILPSKELMAAMGKMFEASDFPPEILPSELGAREQALREELQRKTAASRKGGDRS